MEKELSEAAREAQREYHRRYRKTHKEQIKENRRRYWERKAAQMQPAEDSEVHDEQKEKI